MKSRILDLLENMGPATGAELARRVLAGLTDFREIVLDFQGVRSLGQGFADEVFRVFKASHPAVKLVPKNIDPALRPMIAHVMNGEPID